MFCIFIDTVYKIDKSYYPQTLLKECKYLVKDKEIKRLITKIFYFSEHESENGSEHESVHEYESENGNR